MAYGLFNKTLTIRWFYYGVDGNRKQYQSIQHLVGTKKALDKKITTARLLKF